MAYRAEIQIGVNGLKAVEALKNRVEQLAKAIDNVQNARFDLGTKVRRLSAFQVAQEQKLLSARRKYNDELRQSISLAVQFQQKVEASLRAAQASRAASSRTLTGAAAPAGLLGPAGTVLRRTSGRALPAAGQSASNPFVAAQQRAAQIDAANAAQARLAKAAERRTKAESKAAKAAEGVIDVEVKIIDTGRQFTRASNDLTESTNDLARLRAKQVRDGRQRERTAQRALPFGAGTQYESPAGPERRRGFDFNRLRNRESISNAVIGGAFPLLFGQGGGAAVGGAIGGGLGGLLGGQFGFGLSLVGTALGNTFDQLQAKAVAIGNALQNATSDMEGLRDAGISVTAELEAQVRLLNRYGDTQAAQQRVEQAVALQTGDIGGQGTRLAAGSANELQKAFEGVSAAAATTIGIIGAPFAQAIAAILRGVQAILVVFNAVITAATGLINLIPGAKALGDALFESSLKGTAEYEKRQSQLEQETETLTRTVKEQQKYNDALRAAGQLRNTDFKLSKQILDYRAKERQAVEAVLDKQQELGGGRTAEERARIEANLSAFRTLQNEKLTKERLENEREIITAQENNVKKINEINESTAKTYTDMRIRLERQIQDDRINAIRRIEDAQLKSEKAVIDFREKELKLIQNQRKEQLEVSAALGQLEASFTAAPGREGIAAQLTAAVAQYKNGIIEADENRKLTEAKIQLDAKEAALAVERFKQDNARRVARINEDSARKIAEVNNKLDKQRNESFKYAYDLTVKRLIAQETAAKGQIEQSIVGQRALMSSPFASEAFKQQSAARIGGLQAEIQSIEVTISRLQSLMSKLPQTPGIQSMGALPSLTSQASEVSAAETALNSVLQKGRERLGQLTQENSERSAAAKLALEGINLVSTAAAKQANITNSLNEGNREAAQYIELLKSGVNPELAKQMAAITSASIGVENVIDQTVQQLEALNNPEFKELIDKLLELKGKQGSIVADQAEAAETKKRLEAEKEKIEKIKAISEDLEKNVFKRLGTALEDALVSTIEAAVTGAKDLQETLQEIASSLLKDVGRMFIKAAISGAGTQLGLPGFADGGFAQPGRSYIVGERGPELLTMSASGGYVTNNSASQAAMDRYSGGNSRGGAISVNYNVTEINGMRFVTEDQFREGVAQAAKQGADGGFNRTMSSLKNNRSTRSRIGV